MSGAYGRVVEPTERSEGDAETQRRWSRRTAGVVEPTEPLGEGDVETFLRFLAASRCGAGTPCGLPALRSFLAARPPDPATLRPVSPRLRSGRHPGCGRVVEPTEPLGEGDVETLRPWGGLDVLGRWRSLGLDRRWLREGGLDGLDRRGSVGVVEPTERKRGRRRDCEFCRSVW